jgi:5' nucleotidase, deoxy (Pyrimidine), cytosolic type C protein (NT5C)
MIISFDIDGVLASFNDNLAKVVNLRWPGRIAPDFEPNDWNYTGTIAKNEWDQIWKDIKATPNFWRRQLPYIRNVDAAVKYINATPETTVYFMTARPDTEGGTAYEQTLDWLIEHRLYPFDREVTTPIVVSDPKEKQGIIQELKIDFSIDDKQETVEQCNSIPNHKALLLDRPWNRTSTQPRVYSVDHFLDVVRRALQ